jgi:hypothetical protein
MRPLCRFGSSSVFVPPAEWHNGRKFSLSSSFELMEWSYELVSLFHFRSFETEYNSPFSEFQTRDDEAKHMERSTPSFPSTSRRAIIKNLAFAQTRLLKV